MSERIKVFLVDDEMPVRDAYSRWLEVDGRATVVGEADSIETAKSNLQTVAAHPGRRPDVILLDLCLPPVAGAQIQRDGSSHVIADLIRICPGCKVLVMTQETADEPILAAFADGADGYIWKAETADAIATAVVKVHQGKLVTTISVAEKMLGVYRDLTTRDREVLPQKERHRLLSDMLYRTMKLYCFDGLSAKEIADIENMSLDGVNSRIKKAKEILGVTTRREAFRIMSELGEYTS